MKILFSLSVVLFLTCACESNKSNKENLTQSPHEEVVIDGANSRNSLDWNGAYKSILPCEDCEGIAIQIQLNLDGSFVMHSKYLGKADEVEIVEGEFEWNEAGGKIKLKIDGQDPNLHYYQVGENALFKLDADGNRIGDFDSPYTFVKVGSVLDF